MAALTDEALLTLGTQDLRDEPLGAAGEDIVVGLSAVRHGGEHEELALCLRQHRVAGTDGGGGVMLAAPVVTCMCMDITCGYTLTDCAEGESLLWVKIFLLLCITFFRFICSSPEDKELFECHLQGKWHGGGVKCF